MMWVMYGGVMYGGDDVWLGVMYGGGDVSWARGDVWWG